MKEEMTIKEMLGMIIKNWKVIVIITICGALLLGGYRIISLVDFDKTDTALGNDTQAETENDIQNQVEKAERKVEVIEAALEEKTNYNLNSPYMKINHTNVYRFNIYLNIELYDNEVESTNDAIEFLVNKITHNYRLLVTNDVLEKAYADTEWSDVEKKYLGEIVSVTNTNNAGILVITAIGQDELQAEIAASEIAEFLISESSRVADITSKHNIIELSRNISVSADNRIYETQLNNLRSLDIINDELEDAKSELESVQKKQISTLTHGAVFNSGVKYGALGGVIGFGAAVVFVFVYHAMNTKVTNGIALSKLLECRYLGNINVKNHKKGLKTLGEKLCGEDIYSNISQDDCYMILAANITETTADCKDVLLTGNISDEILEKIEKRLTSLLGNDVKLTSSSNLLTKVESVKLLANVQGVILAVEYGKSETDQIFNDAKYVKEAGKQLLGFIAV